MENQDLFFTQVGSICTHAEEFLGTDLFLRLTLHKPTVNPNITFQSTVMYINQNGKLKMFREYTFPIVELLNDEWVDLFINKFNDAQPNCHKMLGVLTNDWDINWYFEFAIAQFGDHILEKSLNGIIL